MFEEGISLQEARKLSPQQKEQLLGEMEASARDMEAKHWGCSQAVLGRLQKYLKLGGGTDVFKAATGFAAGVGGSLEACGALTGGVMAIGLIYGREKYEEGKISEQQPDFVEALVRARKLTQKFREEFGSLRCADIRAKVRGRPASDDILHYTPEQLAQTIKDHYKCGNVTGPGVRMAAEIILEPTELYAQEIKRRVDQFTAARAVSPK